MTSQITPAAGSPASRARSTAASVWPRRSSTPPSRATRGSKWPGDTNAAAVALSDMMVRIVSARSKAEMPVEIPSRASTVIVNAVEKGSRFSLLIWRSANRSARSRVRARQMSSSTEPGHEIDGFWTRVDRRDDEVAFILPICVINDDNHPTRLHLREDRFDRANLHSGRGSDPGGTALWIEGHVHGSSFVPGSSEVRPLSDRYLLSVQHLYLMAIQESGVRPAGCWPPYTRRQ